jgi:adenine phosphoribosyltransferase
MENVFDKITIIPDFPESGINFRHIGPLLRDHKALKFVCQEIINRIPVNMLNKIDVIAGIDAVGFIFAGIFQQLLKKPLVMIRKNIKIPMKKYTVNYDLEFKNTSMELEVDAIKQGEHVLIIDDLLASGSSLLAAADLIKQSGGNPVIFVTLIELSGLDGRQKIKSLYESSKLYTLLDYPAYSNTLIPSIAPCIKEIHLNCKMYFDSDRPILMCHSTLKGMAERMLKISNLRKSYIYWDESPDSWPNINFEESESLVNKNVVFLMSMERKEIILEQLSVLIILPRQLINSLHIIIPYLGPATHDKTEYSGILSIVEPVLKMISSCIPTTKTGPTILSMYDIHSFHIRFYPTDKVAIKLLTAIPLLKNFLKNECYTIAFPDNRSCKLFKHQFDNYPIIVCSTMKDGDITKFIIKDKFNWPLDKGKREEYLQNVILVDDLVQTGDILIECGKILKEYGFTNISAYATHAVFTNDSWKKFISPHGVFKNFYITNTNPCITDILVGRDPFIILEIEKHLISELQDQNVCIENNTIIHKKIYLTTSNKNIITAVQNIVDPGLDIDNYNQYFSIETSSGVPNQAFGVEEILLGIRNQIENALNIIPEVRDCDSVFSSKNGIIILDKDYYDVALIGAYKRGGLYLSDPKNGYASKINITAYKKYIDKSLQSPNRSITFSEIIESELGYTNGTWREKIGKISQTIQVIRGVDNLSMGHGYFYKHRPGDKYAKL